MVRIAKGELSPTQASLMNFLTVVPSFWCWVHRYPPTYYRILLDIAESYEKGKGKDITKSIQK